MNRINIDTKWICLLGEPLRQSYAHTIMNFLFEETGENYFYRLAEVGPEHLKDVMEGMRYLNCGGLCITKPNKVEVLKYLDELHESAKLMGASNTVVFKDGKYIGYNTDGEGFIRAIKDHVNIEGIKAVNFGVGGAGRACMKLLAEKGAAHIAIIDINQEAAKQVVSEINARHPQVAVCIDPKDTELLHKEMKQADLVTNMTGLGMYKTVNLSPVDISLMDNQAFYFDATYNPEKTKFLKDAEASGHEILNGLDMMLELSAFQFELFTGKTVSIEKVKAFAREMLYKDQSKQ